MQRRVSPRFQNLPNGGNSSIMQRRVSPRFQTLQNGGNLNIMQQKVSPRFQTLPHGGNSNIMQRRVSPRFQNLPNGGNSNIMQPNAGNSIVMQRKVSPRFQNLPKGGNSSIMQRRVSPRFQKLPNGGNSSIMQRRFSPRFQNLPNGGNSIIMQRRVSPRFQTLPNGANSSIMQRRVSPRFQNLPNGRNSNVMQRSVNPRFQTLPNGRDSNIMQRKVSPRFQNLPNGGNSNTMQRRVSPRFQTLPNGGNSNEMQRRVSPRFQNLPNGGNLNIEKISNATGSRKVPKTRVSPRLQSIPLEKRPYYGSSRKRKALRDSQDKVMVKKLKVNHSMLECGSNGSVTVENGEKDIADLQETVSKQNNHVDDLAYNNSVKNKLRLLNKYCLHFTKGEDKRCNTVKGSVSDHETTNGKTKDKENACEGHVKQSKCQGHVKQSKCRGHVKLSKRKCRIKLSECEDHVKLSECPDLKAISEMLNKNEVLCHERYFGDLPGIKVGHRFYSRAEMVAVGLHKHLLKETDYVGKPYGKSEYSGYTFPLAAAIVLSGQYEDDFDSSEEIVYTGEGGNDLLGNKHQSKDQVLLRGNLALKNNKEQSVPVRLIRGHKCDDSYSKRIYIYDGLYKVTDFWDEEGISGFKVFKYRLKRLQGQDNLTSQNQIHFVRGKVSRLHRELPGLVREDISNGQEDKCIPVLNLYNPSVAPTGFKYIKSVQVAKNVSIPPDAPGCNCRGKCTNPRSCSCAQLNGGDFPYVSRDGGRLFEAKDVVFECGPNCGCGPECVNRASQQGLKYHLEIYCTKDKGWAVRSRDFIPSGAPVCEYVGILRKNDELEDISENDYIFEIDCWHTMNGIGGRERRLGDVSLPISNLVNEVDEKTLESVPEPEFCIDASSFGNVARFINHSCDPNLFVQCILSSHHDVRLARIVLFAADDIPPMQELTYDYNYAIDSVIGPDGKTKQLPCFCGAADCRKRLY